MNKIYQPVLFLDCDGVLNSEAHFLEIMSIPKNQRTPDDRKINRKLMSVLNDFVLATNSYVVLSSTWRSDPLDDLNDLFKRFGAEFVISDRTPHLNSLRGNEIRDWLISNSDMLPVPYFEFKNYVIFDDDNDMLLWQQPHYFNIDQCVGITHKVTYKAALYLKTVSPQYLYSINGWHTDTEGVNQHWYMIASSESEAIARANIIIDLSTGTSKIFVDTKLTASMMESGSAFNNGDY